MLLTHREVYYHSCGTGFSPSLFSGQLSRLYRDHPNKNGHLPIRFLCIGSDRVTGDSLGPLIGYKLKKYLPGNVIIGSLEQPVHALNLAETLQALGPEPMFLVAVDAALGEPEHIGCITVSKGAIRPGLGVNKQLPHVGQASVTGIVGSVYGPEASVLQDTRLSLVMDLADSITLGLLRFYCLCMPKLPL